MHSRVVIHAKYLNDVNVKAQWNYIQNFPGFTLESKAQAAKVAKARNHIEISNNSSNCILPFEYTPMLKKISHKIQKVSPNTRIVDYCGSAFATLGSKSATKKAISAERLFLNGRIASTADILRSGDLIELEGSGVHMIKKYQMLLNVVYEDNFLVVINKPGGIAVNGNRFKTIENAVADFNLKNPEADALPRPVAVHRIDVPTNGLVILAKTKRAQIRLSRAFQQNQVKKEYLAIVHGNPPKNGRIDKPIDGKNATTEYVTMRTVSSRNFKSLSLVKLMPVTGRTHQLRIHMKSLGHFIVGDKMYADGAKTILGKGVLLCARRLQFAHPASGKKLDIFIEPPAKFEKLLDREEMRA